jgi:hypothetical protein
MQSQLYVPESSVYAAFMLKDNFLMNPRVFGGIYDRLQPAYADGQRNLQGGCTHLASHLYVNASKRGLSCFAVPFCCTDIRGTEGNVTMAYGSITKGISGIAENKYLKCILLTARVLCSAVFASLYFESAV